MCSHVNVIFSRLTKLEADIQKLTENFKTEQDAIQIDASDFHPDIAGLDTHWVHHTTVVVSVQDLLTSPDPESVNASNTQEEITDRASLTQEIPLQRIPIGLSISPNKFQTIHLKILPQDNNRSPQQNTMLLMKSHN